MSLQFSKKKEKIKHLKEKTNQYSDQVMNLLSIIEKKQKSPMKFFNTSKENKNLSNMGDKNIKTQMLMTQYPNLKGNNQTDLENNFTETKSMVLIK